MLRSSVNHITCVSFGILNVVFRIIAMGVVEANAETSHLKVDAHKKIQTMNFVRLDEQLLPGITAPTRRLAEDFATTHHDLMNAALDLQLSRGSYDVYLHMISNVRAEGVITKDNLTNRVFRFVFNSEYQFYCCIMLATFELKQFCVIRVAYMVCIPKFWKLSRQIMVAFKDLLTLLRAMVWLFFMFCISIYAAAACFTSPTTREAYETTILSENSVFTITDLFGTLKDSVHHHDSLRYHEQTLRSASSFTNYFCPTHWTTGAMATMA